MEGRIYRTWSTDWFYNPRRETERLVAFLDERRRLSPADQLTEWKEEADVISEKPGESTAIIDESTDALSGSAGDEDLFVEVEDRVTYCFVADPNVRYTVLIVETPSNPKGGIINEQTPVAQALLGLSAGDVGDLDVPGQKKRQVRVLTIERPEEQGA